ncbi:MAG: site-specific integrase [Sandaracinaceae bacterium]|nr:site-specific integrase [Sandaracinaceae bacterium]
MDFHWEHQRGPLVGTRQRFRLKSPVNSKRGADEYERVLRARLFDGMPLDGSDPKVKSIPTFAAFADEFLSSYVRANNKPSVQKEKKCVFALHLTPRFGPMRLDLVREREIERFKAESLDKGVSAKRLKNILAVLSKMLHYAEEVAVIERAPRVRMPKIAPVKSDFLSDDEYARLRDAVKQHTERFAMIVVAGETGLCKGEILGLEWGDIDFVAKTLTVRRSVWRELRNESHVGAPKSGRDRKIPMTHRLIAALRAHRHLRAERVFCNEDGSELTPGTMEVTLRTACRRAGLRQIGWHVLRHSFGSTLAQRGASPKSIQELMGHSDVSTTMRYMHLAPSHHREAISLLDDDAQRSSVALGT